MSIGYWNQFCLVLLPMILHINSWYKAENENHFDILGCTLSEICTVLTIFISIHVCYCISTGLILVLMLKSDMYCVLNWLLWVSTSFMPPLLLSFCSRSVEYTCFTIDGSQIKGTTLDSFPQFNIGILCYSKIIWTKQKKNDLFKLSNII